MKKRDKTKPKACVLCGVALSETEYATLFTHPVDGPCAVRVTNVLGLSVDDLYFVADDDGKVYQREEATDAPSFGGPDLAAQADGSVYDPTGGSAFLSADGGARRMFEHAGIPFLGGMSGLRGWSSIGTYQTCPYLWKLTYGGGSKDVVNPDVPKSEALEVGTLLHLFTAIHYMRIIQNNPATADAKAFPNGYPLTPEDALTFLRHVMVTPGYLDYAWGLFDAYRIEYQDELEWMTPLAVEHLAMDPRDGVSCRWDLTFRIDHPHGGQLPGVYVCNTKTASDKGKTTLEQWHNDGQILGEVDLYSRLKYEKLWGPLRGACINLVIKTKTPQFHRTWVSPPKSVLRSHRYERGIWIAQMELAAATGLYPRSRASCVTKWRGLCQLFEHCSGADAPREFA